MVVSECTSLGFMGLHCALSALFKPIQVWIAERYVYIEANCKYYFSTYSVGSGEEELLLVDAASDAKQKLWSTLGEFYIKIR